LDYQHVSGLSNWLVYRLALVDKGASGLADWRALVVLNRGVSTVLSYWSRVVYFDLCSQMECGWGYVTDKYIADFLADKSADRSVWIRMEKLSIDRPYLTDMENN
jgi:hypothetical protein